MQPEGRDQRWVCVSQLMRVSTDRLHHQHPTLTAVEGSIPNVPDPRYHRRDNSEPGPEPGLTPPTPPPLPSDNIVYRGCHLTKKKQKKTPPSCKIVSSLWWWTARMLQSVNQSHCRQCQWRCVCVCACVNLDVCMCVCVCVYVLFIFLLSEPGAVVSCHGA